MEETRLTPGAVLLAALLLAVLADLLVWNTAWGLAFTLWVVTLTMVLMVLVRASPQGTPRGWQGGLFVMALMGLAASWRDSPVLHGLDALSVAGCLVLVLLRPSHGTLLLVRFSELVRESIAGIVDGLLGTPALIAADRRRGQAGPSLAPMLRGGLLALPLLIIFGALFGAADATFEYILVSVLDIDQLFRHGMVISVLSWGFAGILYGRFIHSPAGPLRTLGSEGPSLGIIEVSLPLGAVVMLSGLFVLTQVAYLFGGASYVLGTPEVTVAEYARRGFFELVAVTALALPLLLAAEWLLRRESRRARLVFGVLAGVQLALMVTIMASAFHRLAVYLEAFGLTESRLYAAAFLVWVGCVCVLYAATVLRGRRERFVTLSFLAGVLVVLGLHGLNPDARIAAVNLSRVERGAVLDTTYLGRLSADAVPALLQSLGSLAEEDRRAIRTILDRRGEELEKGDWRGWNLGSAHARRLLGGLREPDAMP